MNLLRLFFELLLVYILYKLVFDLVIPLYQSTRIMKKKMEQFKEGGTARTEKEKPKSGVEKYDYIDFEEVK